MICYMFQTFLDTRNNPDSDYKWREDGDGSKGIFFLSKNSFTENVYRI